MMLTQMAAYPMDDTEYTAEALGLEHATRGRGVFSGDNNLSLTPAGGMQVTLSVGVCYLKMDAYWGVTCKPPAPKTITLAPSDGVLHRYDIIKARLNKAGNLAGIFLQSTAASSAPVLPAQPQRDDNADEVFLHAIKIRAGALEILASDITDLRLNEAYCGLMRDGVTGLPTAQLSAQATALIGQLQEELAAANASALYAIVITDTITLSATGWSAAAPYTQTVPAPRMAARYEPLADVALSGTPAQKAAQLEAWACVSELVTGSGTVTVTCLEDKPTVALSARLKAVV